MRRDPIPATAPPGHPASAEDASRMPWVAIIAFGALLAVTTGCRQSLGLFVRPLAATGVGVAAVSFALALGQFWWGASQPLFGALVHRLGSYRVLAAGGVLLAAGLGLAPFATTPLGLIATLGFLSAIGTGAASFAVVAGAIAERVAPARQAMAAAYVNVGASVGQFVFAPLTQAVMTAGGWPVAMWTLAAAAASLLLIAWPATRRARSETAVASAHLPLGEALRTAFGERSYWYLHVAFFTCGFHISFLSTHLPSEVALCGLPAGAAAFALAIIGIANISGTLAFGWLGTRYPIRWLLAALYGVRAVAIVAYLLVPKTLLTLYVFSAVLGGAWLATVPLTAGLIARLFGARHLSMLFGLTFFTHQIGAFFGAWLGGLAVAASGSYRSVWIADVALASIAVFASLPVREPRPAGTPVAA